jgi:hypothetical protein
VFLGPYINPLGIAAAMLISNTISVAVSQRITAKLLKK